MLCHLCQVCVTLPRTYKTYLFTARVVVELATGADEASLNAGVLLKNISSAEVAVEERPSDAHGHTWMVQPLLIDLLQQQH